jgi:hypothetical protein
VKEEGAQPGEFDTGVLSIGPAECGSNAAESNESQRQLSEKGECGFSVDFLPPNGSAFSGVRRPTARPLDASGSRDSTTVHLGTA